jgi:hypothetical protein
MNRFFLPMWFYAFGVAILPAVFASAEQPAERKDPIAGRTTLGVQGSRFTLNGKPTFLLGISYYGGLGASEDAIKKDLDDMQKAGFNWLRVWATWGGFGRDVSAIDEKGAPREPYLEKLKWLVAECDRRGLVVDVTLTRGERTEDGAGRIPDFPAHERAVETILQALKPHRNWYLDLANERDVGDARFVGLRELKLLREKARELSPQLLVTASFGGHDLSKGDVGEAIEEVGVDFLCVHRPRHADSPGQTQARTREVLAICKELGRNVPVHHQEPFRRGYEAWNPNAQDFLTDLRGAVLGGAAGWCFHNGSERGNAQRQPRRSFDLGEKRLFDQLDAEEQKVVANVKAVLEDIP